MEDPTARPSTPNSKLTDETRHEPTDEPGDRSSAARRSTPHLAARLYQELRRLARVMMKNRAPGTLQPTALVNEVYLRLARAPQVLWDHSGHFFGAAAIAMRQILADDYRRKAAGKRGGGWDRVEFDEEQIELGAPSIDFLALHVLLDEFKLKAPRQHRIVMLRYFSGLTAEETAEVLGLSLRSVERDWAFARTYLYTRLSEQ